MARKIHRQLPRRLGGLSASSNPNSIPESPRGVKEELSELKNTLSRQLRGVTSFLAPPPPPPDEGSTVMKGVMRRGGGEVKEGIRSDFMEIEGRFRSGISRISNNKVVLEFTKIAPSLLQLGEEDEAEGVSEVAVAFARNVAMHPRDLAPLSDRFGFSTC